MEIGCEVGDVSTYQICFWLAVFGVPGLQLQASPNPHFTYDKNQGCKISPFFHCPFTQKSSLTTVHHRQFSEAFDWKFKNLGLWPSAVPRILPHSVTSTLPQPQGLTYFLAQETRSDAHAQGLVIFWWFETGSNEFRMLMNFVIDNLPDTPSSHTKLPTFHWQLNFSSKALNCYQSHLKAGRVPCTKQRWISFHSPDICSTNKAWKSSQNREPLEDVEFKVLFDSQILSSHALCPISELPRQRPKRRWVGFSSEKIYIYILIYFIFLGKIDAISSDYSLNGFCGLRSLECLWVKWCKLRRRAANHRVTDLQICYGFSLFLSWQFKCEFLYDSIMFYNVFHHCNYMSRVSESRLWIFSHPFEVNVSSRGSYLCTPPQMKTQYLLCKTACFARVTVHFINKNTWTWHLTMILWLNMPLIQSPSFDFIKRVMVSFDFCCFFWVGFVWARSRPRAIQLGGWRLHFFLGWNVGTPTKSIEKGRFYLKLHWQFM